MSFWRKQPILKGYVSEVDRFLQEFDLKPEASSDSRRAEEAKSQWIGKRRDHADIQQPAIKIWEDTQDEGN